MLFAGGALRSGPGPRRWQQRGQFFSQSKVFWLIICMIVLLFSNCCTYWFAVRGERGSGGGGADRWLGLTTADTDICTWDTSFRPLSGQEWIDVPILPISHPLLPPKSTTTTPLRVYATKRPAGSYALFPEFWDSVINGMWEPDTFRLIRAVHLARPNGIHLDIGAWVGPTALFAAHFAARVVALEPDPRAFSELLANIQLNPSIASRARVFRHCLGAKTGPVVMEGPLPLGSSMSRVTGSGSGVRIPSRDSAEKDWPVARASWPAMCSTPMEFAAKTGLNPDAITLIKVDVEGAEAELLIVLAEWIFRDAATASTTKTVPPTRRPSLLVELHRGMWLNPSAASAAIRKALSSWKYVYRSRAGAKRLQNGLSRFTLFFPESEDTCAEEYCTIFATDEPFDWTDAGGILGKAGFIINE